MYLQWRISRARPVATEDADAVARQNWRERNGHFFIRDILPAITSTEFNACSEVERADVIKAFERVLELDEHDAELSVVRTSRSPLSLCVR